MSDLPAAVHTLERDLNGIFGTRLRSFVAYGLRGHAAGGGAHHGHHHKPAPMHTLAVVDQLTSDDLRSCASRVANWHDSGLATPLVLGSLEFERSLDAFPFEFGDILTDHTVVAGSNPFLGLSIDDGDLRRACEVQARGHLLHLRQGYLETRGRADALADLIVQSAPAFAALVRSVARLEGRVTDDPAAAARLIERTLGLGGSTASDIVALAGVDEIASAEAQRLFPPYLDAAERLVAHVDLWKGASE